MIGGKVHAAAVAFFSDVFFHLFFILNRVLLLFSSCKPCFQKHRQQQGKKPASKRTLGDKEQEFIEALRVSRENEID